MNAKIVALLLLTVCYAVMMHQVSAAIGPQCLLPLERGPCRAFIPKYGYNPETNKCELFEYGGCQGNENNFQTLDSCKQVCF
ncbi:hemolymph trypsin inhibitor B-like [Ceratina calcarata]|uniref:Hemolymph trypsin inhibitor B-like n=1 Tax=Ceratina calcarata TaxID=156304 RepID=A0AAJ7IY52_9HYME|nr:hemolymph trypsin inhibitor B-like [Ceratina calcarata]